MALAHQQKIAALQGWGRDSGDKKPECKRTNAAALYLNWLTGKMIKLLMMGTFALSPDIANMVRLL